MIFDLRSHQEEKMILDIRVNPNGNGWAEVFVDDIAIKILYSNFMESLCLTSLTEILSTINKYNKSDLILDAVKLKKESIAARNAKEPRDD